MPCIVYLLKKNNNWYYQIFFPNCVIFFKLSYYWTCMLIFYLTQYRWPQKVNSLILTPKPLCQCSVFWMFCRTIILNVLKLKLSQLIAIVYFLEPSVYWKANTEQSRCKDVWCVHLLSFIFVLFQLHGCPIFTWKYCQQYWKCSSEHSSCVLQP